MSAEYLTVSQAAARLGISERTVQRRCKRGQLSARLETTPDGTQWLIDPATLPTGDATTADKVPTLENQQKPAIQVQNESSQPPTNATGADTADKVPTGDAIELLEHLRDENKFLRTLIEQRDRDAAELRAALRKALEAMPKALTNGGKLDEVGHKKEEPANVPPAEQSTPPAPRSGKRPQLTAWQRAAARILGIR